MDIQYSTDMIDYLYEDGDRDYVLFGQIISIVSYDREDHPFNKTDKQILIDSINLTKYLVSTGDFNIGKTIKTSDNNFSYIILNMDDFIKQVEQEFKKSGVKGEIHYVFWLKKLNKNKRTLDIPDSIRNLFV